MTKKEPTAVAITEEQLHQNEMLSLIVEENSELKKLLVEFTGTKLNKEEVTVHMIAEVLAVEFPEFMYPMAEENFLLGYQQGLKDAEKLYRGTPEAIEE